MEDLFWTLERLRKGEEPEEVVVKDGDKEDIIVPDLKVPEEVPKDK